MSMSITDIAWYTSFSKHWMWFVSPFSCRLLRLASKAAAWPVRVLLLLDTIGYIRREILILTFVDGLVLLDGGATATFDCDRVFITGVTTLTVKRAAARCCLSSCFAFAAF